MINKKISLAFFLAAVVLAMALVRRGDATEGGGSDQRTSQGGPISALDGDDSAVKSGKMRDVVIPASEAGNADTSAFAALRTGSAKGQTDAVLGAVKALKDCMEYQRLQERLGHLSEAIAGKMENAARNATTAPDADIQALVDQKERASAAFANLASACDGVRREDLEAAWKYQYMAARSGDADAILDYVLTPQISAAQLLADPDTGDIYREQAPRLLESLIARNDVRAIKAYVRAGYDEIMQPRSQRFHEALSRVLKPDPVRVLAYDLALGNAGVPPFGQGMDTDAMRSRVLNPAQVIQAEAMARELAPRLQP